MALQVVREEAHKEVTKLLLTASKIRDKLLTAKRIDWANIRTSRIQLANRPHYGRLMLRDGSFYGYVKKAYKKLSIIDSMGINPHELDEKQLARLIVRFQIAVLYTQIPFDHVDNLTKIMDKGRYNDEDFYIDKTISPFPKPLEKLLSGLATAGYRLSEHSSMLSLIFIHKYGIDAYSKRVVRKFNQRNYVD